MLAREVLIVAVMVLAVGCSFTPAMRNRRTTAWLRPVSMTCAEDGQPIRVLISERCANGVCGWSCHPDRWQK